MTKNIQMEMSFAARSRRGAGLTAHQGGRARWWLARLRRTVERTEEWKPDSSAASPGFQRGLQTVAQ